MNKCEACSKIQNTCCRQKHVEVPLTPGDLRRIAEHSGRHDFFELRRVSDELKVVYESPSNVHTGSEVYVRHLFDAEGRRPVLRKRAGQDCPFLGAAGCELPLDVRPLACRLYPYNWNDDEQIWLDPTYCPPRHFANEEEMKAAICVPEDEARRLVALFHREIGMRPAPATRHENRFHLQSEE